MDITICTSSIFSLVLLHNNGIRKIQRHKNKVRLICYRKRVACSKMTIHLENLSQLSVATVHQSQPARLRPQSRSVLLAVLLLLCVDVRGIHILSNENCFAVLRRAGWTYYEIEKNVSSGDLDSLSFKHRQLTCPQRIFCVPSIVLNHNVVVLKEEWCYFVYRRYRMCKYLLIIWFFYNL